MKKFASLFLAGLLVTSCGPRLQDALTSGKLSDDSARKVSFAVISGVGPGASRDGDPIEHFVKNVKRCNKEKVDLAIVLGDVTAAAGDAFAEQVDVRDEACRALTKPHILVPGDRDVWDQASREQWEKRYGPLYFSWDYRGVHFIVLCSDVPGQTNRIADPQLAWLTEDLMTPFRSKRVFVFVHKPLWTYRGDKGAESNQWNTDVHPLLAQYGVDTVFAGHERRYCLYPTRDNVRYVLTGGGTGEYELAGEFPHFVKVDVTSFADVPDGPNPPTTLTVVTADKSLPPQCVMSEPLEMLRQALTATVSRPAGKVGQVELKVSVPNPTDLPSKAVLTWDHPGSTWTAANVQGDVPVGGRATLVAKVAFTRLLSLPAARVELQAAQRKLFGWPDVLGQAIAVAVARRTKVVDIPKLAGIRIGSDDKDWADGGLRIDALSTIGRTVARKGVSAARVRLGWDDAGLLAIVNVRDETITPAATGRLRITGDSVQLCVSSGPGRDDAYCFTIAAPKGKGLSLDVLGKTAADGRKLTAQVGSKLVEGGYVVEVRLPWSNLGISPKPGLKVGVQVLINDVDGDGTPVRMGWYPVGHPLSTTGGVDNICIVRLAEQASAPEILAIRAGTVLPLASSVELVAPADLAGKTVAVKQGDKTLAAGTLRLQAGSARADLTFALSPEGGPVGTVDVYLDGKKVDSVDLGKAR